MFQFDIRQALKRSIYDRVSSRGKFQDFSSTQIDLPELLAESIRDFGVSRIPNELLFDKGREDDIHVTVKYGLHTQNPDDVSRVVKEAGLRPFNVILGTIDLFQIAGGDVVKINVLSPSLVRMNSVIGKSLKSLSNSDTHLVYQAHVTIAYVKSGSCNHLIGDTSFFGESFIADTLTFSPATGQKVQIPLKSIGRKSFVPLGQFYRTATLGRSREYRPPASGPITIRGREVTMIKVGEGSGREEYLVYASGLTPFWADPDEPVDVKSIRSTVKSGKAITIREYLRLYGSGDVRGVRVFIPGKEGHGPLERVSVRDDGRYAVLMAQDGYSFTLPFDSGLEMKSTSTKGWVSYNGRFTGTVDGGLGLEGPESPRSEKPEDFISRNAYISKLDRGTSRGSKPGYTLTDQPFKVTCTTYDGLYDTEEVEYAMQAIGLERAKEIGEYWVATGRLQSGTYLRSVSTKGGYIRPTVGEAYRLYTTTGLPHSNLDIEYRGDAVEEIRSHGRAGYILILEGGREVDVVESTLLDVIARF